MEAIALLDESVAAACEWVDLFLEGNTAALLPRTHPDLRVAVSAGSLGLSSEMRAACKDWTWVPRSRPVGVGREEALLVNPAGVAWLEAFVADEPTPDSSEIEFVPVVMELEGGRWLFCGQPEPEHPR